MTREQLLETAKPILFNTEMVRAILDGRKTVTRRICKDGNDHDVPDMNFYDADKRTYAVHSFADKEHTDRLGIAERTCPICPGDILYVRETWCELKNANGSHKRYVYKATDTFPFGETGYIIKFSWDPSIHMPKAAARIFLKVTDVRVERLQEITDKEAEKEGAQPQNPFDYTVDKWPNLEHFKEIWNSTIKKSDLDRYGWEANPYVFVIEFERVYPD